MVTWTTPVLALCVRFLHKVGETSGFGRASHPSPRRAHAKAGTPWPAQGSVQALGVSLSWDGLVGWSLCGCSIVSEALFSHTLSEPWETSGLVLQRLVWRGQGLFCSERGSESKVLSLLPYPELFLSGGQAVVDAFFAYFLFF